ncbi:four-carbon acid sugar kinase family protein [Opitutus sp. ER46]|uniref:four-carbon acid sugar kinase family protein n=1 Tax=Opitutus sp. ER46 TaxID=2161864 RepID=UPI000D2FF2AD|nr:four-carbon acid sugar kinase family protein [Opitutus sp. ER46]PTX99088.1 serine kinase [Opitutus sp. ER46]
MNSYLAYYGDDFTGSTDALEWLTRAGFRTVLFTGVPTAEQLRRFGQLDAVGVAGCTRALAPGAMAAELQPAFAALRALGAAHVHYKVCSTFDSAPHVGSIGRAIELGRAAFGGPFVPLVVGAPALGRYCVFGNLFARFGIGSAGAVHRLDRHPAMRRHPVTPADESDLRLHLARQTGLPVGLFDVLAQELEPARRDAELARLVSEGAEIVLFDVMEPAHLEHIGALLGPLGEGDRPLFSVGSSAIEMALGGYAQQTGRVTPRSTWAEVGAVSSLLVVSGSCSPVSVRQIAWAANHGFAEVGLAPDADEAEVTAAIATATAHRREGRHIVVHTRPDRIVAAPVRPECVGAMLGRVAKAVLGATRGKRLLIAGGDTSSYTARTLGIEAVEMIAPLAPGAPLCRAHAAAAPIDGLEVNFKGGQVGAEDYFGAVARGAL